MYAYYTVKMTFRTIHIQHQYHLWIRQNSIRTISQWFHIWNIWINIDKTSATLLYMICTFLTNLHLKRTSIMEIYSRKIWFDRHITLTHHLKSTIVTHPSSIRQTQLRKIHVWNKNTTYDLLFRTQLAHQAFIKEIY